MKKIMMLLFIALIPEIVSAATEYATFEAFYKEETSYIGWISAGIGAVIAGAAIIFTGGAATPIVAGVGTWIGGMMGYSGIVATNVGLALLGGGSMLYFPLELTL